MNLANTFKFKTISKQAMLLGAGVPIIISAFAGSYALSQYVNGQSTITLSEKSMNAVGQEAEKMIKSVDSVRTQPALLLKLDSHLASLDFKKGGVELTEAAKIDLRAQIEKFSTASVKVHTKGYSGNINVAYSVRRGLAFERAYAVKKYLVENGVAPEKVRIFYFSEDHSGKPRAEANWLMSDEDVAQDLKLSLQK